MRETERANRGKPSSRTGSRLSSVLPPATPSSMGRTHGRSNTGDGSDRGTQPALLSKKPRTNLWLERRSHRLLCTSLALPSRKDAIRGPTPNVHVQKAQSPAACSEETQRLPESTGLEREKTEEGTSRCTLAGTAVESFPEGVLNDLNATAHLGCQPTTSFLTATTSKYAT